MEEMEEYGDEIQMQVRIKNTRNEINSFSLRKSNKDLQVPAKKLFFCILLIYCGYLAFCYPVDVYFDISNK